MLPLQPHSSADSPNKGKGKGKDTSSDSATPADALGESHGKRAHSVPAAPAIQQRPTQSDSEITSSEPDFASLQTRSRSPSRRAKTGAPKRPKPKSLNRFTRPGTVSTPPNIDRRSQPPTKPRVQPYPACPPTSQSNHPATHPSRTCAPHSARQHGEHQRRVSTWRCRSPNRVRWGNPRSFQRCRATDYGGHFRPLTCNGAHRRPHTPTIHTTKFSTATTGTTTTARRSRHRKSPMHAKRFTNSHWHAGSIKSAKEPERGRRSLRR